MKTETSSSRDQGAQSGRYCTSSQRAYGDSSQGLKKHRILQKTSNEKKIVHSKQASQEEVIFKTVTNFRSFCSKPKTSKPNKIEITRNLQNLGAKIPSSKDQSKDQAKHKKTKSGNQNLRKLQQMNFL